MRLSILVTLISCIVVGRVSADGPSDNVPDAVRRVPPPGIKIADPDRAELEAGVTELGKEIESLRGELKARPALLDLLPDAQICHKAVDWALRHDEFYKSNEVQVARALLQQGMERARALRNGSAPWTNATGLVVRGFVSRIEPEIVYPFSWNGILLHNASVRTGPPRSLQFPAAFLRYSNDNVVICRRVAVLSAIECSRPRINL